MTKKQIKLEIAIIRESLAKANGEEWNGLSWWDVELLNRLTKVQLLEKLEALKNK